MSNVKINSICSKILYIRTNNLMLPIFNNKSNKTLTSMYSTCSSLIPYKLNNTSIILYKPNNTSIIIYKPVTKSIIVHTKKLPLINTYPIIYLPSIISNPLQHIFNKYPKHKDPIESLLNKRKGGYNSLIDIKQKPLFSCDNFGDLVKRHSFYKKIRGKGGIYMIKYKHCSKIFYIGRTLKFSTRFLTHYTKSQLNSSSNNQLYTLVNKIGWEHFTFNILEILPQNLDLQIKIENRYLTNNLPLLNKIMFAKIKALTLVGYKAFLKKRQRPIIEERSTWGGVLVYVYKYVEETVNNEGKLQFIGSYYTYKLVTKITGIRSNDIGEYINTDISKNGYLFYSSPLTNLDFYYQLITKLMIENPNPHIKAVPIWAYTKNDKGEFILVNGKPFPNMLNFAYFINLSEVTIREYVNSLKPDSVNGIYYFTAPISDEIINSILNNPANLKNQTTKVYAYNGLTMELINGKPFDSIISTVNFFGLNKTTVYRNLDTFKASIWNEQYVYLFRNKLTVEKTMELLKNPVNNKRKANIAVGVWVYRKQDDGNLIPFNNNKPTFDNISKAAIEFGVSAPTISRRIKAGINQIPINGLVFFSEEKS